MKDMTIKGTGNSRFLKSVSNFLTLYPNYESFVAALVAGTLPVDFNGTNAAGINQAGTPLNKANLLSDDTANVIGLGEYVDPTVNQAVYRLYGLIFGGPTYVNNTLELDGFFAGRWLTPLSAAATVAIPSTDSLFDGIEFHLYGASVGLTVEANGNRLISPNLPTATSYRVTKVAHLKKLGSNNWILYGDVEAAT